MRRFLRIIGWIIASILIILLCAIIALQTPAGKNFVRKQALNFLRNKLQTEVQIGGIGYSLPKMLELTDVLFLDQSDDTLLAARKLRVDMNMLALIRGKVVVNQISLEGLNAHIYRNAPDTNFNFTYIIQAFSGGKQDPTAEEMQQANDTSSSLSFDIDRVHLDDIRVRFDDYTGGNRLAVNLKQLRLSLRRIDPANLDFGIKKLMVSGLGASFIQDTSYLPQTPDTGTSADLHLAADEIILDQVAFRYSNNLSKFLFDLDLGHLLAKPKHIDLVGQRVDINTLALDSTRIIIAMGATSSVPAKADTLTDTIASQNWRVQVKDINFRDIHFKMDDAAAPHQPYGMDYSHLDVQHLNFSMDDLLYATDTISGNVKHLSLQERSGLELKELRTQFVYVPQGAVLRNLYLQTDQTLLQKHLEIAYPSLEALTSHPELVRLQINLEKSVIGIRDVLLFVPDLRHQEFFARNQNSRLNLDAVLKGFMNDIQINHFNLSGLSNTEIALKGRLRGLPDADRLSYDLHIERLKSSRNDLEPLLPADTRQQFRLPDAFGLSGSISGTSKDYNPQLAIITTDGNAFVKGYVHLSPGSNRERYDLLLKTDRLNLGRILKQDSLMGRISLDLAVKGRSFDVKSMNTDLRGTIHAAELKGYAYHDIRMNGRLKDQEGEIRLVSEDPNIVLQLVAHASFRDSFPAIVADLNIDSINFQALNLSEENFKLRTKIHADVPVANPDYPQAKIVVDRSIMQIQGKRYQTDSMFLTSKPNPDSGQHIIVDLGLLYASVTGHTPLSKAAPLIQEHISRHYAPGSDTILLARQGKNTTALPYTNADTNSTNKAQISTQIKDTQKLPDNYDLQFTARITDGPLLHAFAPELKYLDTMHIDAEIDTRTLDLKLTAPRIVYGTNEITGTTLKVAGRDSALTYQVFVENFTQPKRSLHKTSLEGGVSNNEITAVLNIRDTGNTPRFALSAKLQQQGADQVLTLGNRLLLDYKEWQVAEPNRIVFGPQGFFVEGFEIRNGAESIRINSESPKYNAPITASIEQFALSNITRMVSQGDTLLADGKLSATINLRQLSPDPLMTATMEIRDLSVLNVLIGNLSAQAEHEHAHTIKATLGIEGQGNDIRLAGNYYTQPVQGNEFDFDLKLNAVNLKSLEGLAMNQIRNSSGNIRGELKIQGTTQTPSIRGMVRTDQLATTISMLGMQYRMPDERITFNPDGIRFEKFDILDSAGNKITIDGLVNTSNSTNMLLDLNIRAKNFKALSSTVRDNKFFYGSVVVSSNLNIKGPVSAPDIDGSLAINRGTLFTVALPESEVSMEESEGIVKFVNMNDSSGSQLWQEDADTMPRFAMKAGSGINVNLNIDSSAEFKVIIDAGTGDNLRVRGAAALNAAITPGGELTLSGRYELREGAYQLNYNLIRRRFDIKRGSTITFAGDPLDADMDITAIYVANIAPYDLVERQVGDPAQLNYYKQRLPFDVQLKMRGALMKPFISFDIDLPEGKLYRMSSEGVDLVQARLNQLRTDTAELNKQVFAVLILNRFIGEDPFASSGDGDVSSFARQSASRFISAQLNKYASSLIKGVDLSVDLVSADDYSTGERRDRTDLNISASKNLFNDRLTVTIGNDFELESSQSNSNKNTSLIPGNLAADYRLTQDGRYMMRAYRQDQNDGVLQGYITETGLNFIATFEYNRFRNLFNKKRRERAREERKLQQELKQKEDSERKETTPQEGTTPVQNREPESAG